MVEELKPFQFAIAAGVILGVAMFLMGLVGWGTGASRQYYGMMGMMGYDYTATGSIVGLVGGAVLGFLGGGAFALLYNYLCATMK